MRIIAMISVYQYVHCTNTYSTYHIMIYMRVVIYNTVYYTITS